jgi:hypothetical protein
VHNGRQPRNVRSITYDDIRPADMRVPFACADDNETATNAVQVDVHGSFVSPRRAGYRAIVR